MIFRYLTLSDVDGTSVHYVDAFEVVRVKAVNNNDNPGSTRPASYSQVFMRDGTTLHVADPAEDIAYAVDAANTGGWEDADFEARLKVPIVRGKETITAKLAEVRNFQSRFAHQGMGGGLLVPSRLTGRLPDMEP